MCIIYGNFKRGINVNIGFDIDGVLNDIESFQLKYGLIFFKNKYIQNYYKQHGVLLEESSIVDSDIIINPNGYGIKEVFNCTDEEEVEFWTKYTFKFFFEHCRKGTSEVIKKLRDQGNKVFLISSRALTTENSTKGKFMRILLKEWLKREKIEYDDIIYCSVENSSVDKVEACLRLSIDIFVEDKKENIEALSSITNVICLNTMNNFDNEIKNITRINNLEEELYIAIRNIQISNNSFTFLSKDEKNILSHSELISYYKDLRNYYLKLPYNEEKRAIGRENCENTMKIMLPFFNKYYNPHILNQEKLINQNGIILASNHLHSFDPLLVINQMHDKSFRLLAKSELLESQIGKLFKHIDSIFVNNDDELSKHEAKEELIKTLLHGVTVMQFPEGTRNKTDKYLLDFHYGTVDIAQKTGVPIIPFAVNADYKFMGKNLYANVGDPIYVKPEDDLTEMNSKLQDAIATLLWEIIEKGPTLNNGEKDKLKCEAEKGRTKQLNKSLKIA
jgi:1-acyl-sn-glycerol-3-phosphate acyltransferase